MKITTLFTCALMLFAESSNACAERQVMSDVDKSLQVHDAAFSYSQDGRDGVVTTIGSIKNTSNSTVDELVIEVRYFDGNNVLVDALTQPLYGMVIPPGQDVIFRVRDTADKQKSAYASSTARIVSAEQRVVVGRTKSDSTAFTNFIISWGPMLLLIGVWVVFMRKITKKGSPQRRSVELLEKQTETLSRQLEIFERLTVAIEKSVTKNP